VHQAAHLGVVGLLRRLAGHRKVAGQAQLVFEEVPDAAGIGLVGDHREAGGAEEILRDRAPQIPDRLDRAVLFAFDEGLGVQAQQLAQLAQEFRGAVQPDRRLQVGPPSASHSMRPNSRYMQMLTSAFTRRDTSARWLPSGNTMLISAPMPSTRRRISARSDWAC
jgi:hypothetical protein